MSQPPAPIQSAATEDGAKAGSVLLVDDDPSVLRAFERTLSGGAYRIETFSSALEAVQRFPKGGIQVIVSDISMPHMCGVVRLRSVREHDADLPVILITGRPTVESAANSVEYGAFRYLVKPASPAELRKTVDNAANLYRLARMKREALELAGTPGGAGDLAGLEASFNRALVSLWVAFQPIVSVNDGCVFGYEALLRCQEPSLPGPEQVIRAAERLGGLSRLGRTVRDHAAMPLRDAKEAPTLFVNLHPEDLLDPHLLDSSSALTGIADRVVLEITERPGNCLRTRLV
jgi:CheY-like chemotaxis protein